jgi:hypothetical protein
LKKRNQDLERLIEHRQRSIAKLQQKLNDWKLVPLEVSLRNSSSRQTLYKLLFLINIT